MDKFLDLSKSRFAILDHDDDPNVEIGLNRQKLLTMDNEIVSNSSFFL